MDAAAHDSPERMSVLDEAWLRLDQAGPPRIILGQLRFDGALELGRLHAALRERMRLNPRFAQRAWIGADGASWLAVPGFDPASHVTVRALAPRDAATRLRRAVGRLLHERLPMDRPLWRFHVFTHDGVRRGPGWTLVARVHHCLGDGLSMVALLAGISDEAAARSRRPTRANDDNVRRPNELESALGRIDPRRWLERWRAGDLAGLVEGGLAAWFSPLAQALRAEAARLAALRRETTGSLSSGASGRKDLSVCAPFDALAVKRAAHALGCSVNDMLVSSLAAALREQLSALGESVEGAELRALVPASLRRPGEAVRPGNRFGMLVLMLPVGEPHALPRLYEVQRRMHALKNSWQSMLSVAAVWMLAICPPPLRAALSQRFELRASAVISHVPGPRRALHLAGSRLREAAYWVAPTGDIGVGVSALAYAGMLRVGIVTDRQLVPEPRLLVQAFTRELQWLLHHAPSQGMQTSEADA